MNDITDDYLDGFEDIAELIDDKDDEMWDRYFWLVNSVALKLGIEMEVVYGEVE
jgi:hypothetical protein